MLPIKSEAYLKALEAEAKREEYRSKGQLPIIIITNEEGKK
jgi:hypothetical protein